MLSERKGETIKILIVEDEIIVAEDIKDVLEEKGYIVVAIASSGEEAITQAAEKKPHLVLMDIRLRGKIDGVQAAEQIWNTHKIPILYLTANSDPNTIERAKTTEPFGYITKPFKEQELHTAVEIALNRYQIERKIQEREQWLHTILNSLGDAVIATDNQNCVTLLNPVAEALTGWKQSDAFGKNSTDIFQIIHEETRTQVESPITKALQSGNSVILPEQTLLIARNGAETPIDDSATPIKGDRGEIMGGVVVFRDIGERKRLQKRLETHHGITRILAEANTLTEAIPQLLQRLCKGLDWDLGEFWVVDPQANVLRYADSWHLPSVNVSAFVEVARQFSFSPGAGLPGRTWESGQPIWITTIDRDARFLRSFAAARSRLRSAFGFPIASGSQSLGVMTFFSRQIQPPDEDLLQMFATIGSQIGQFIEKKRSEAALRESEQRLAWQAKHDPLTGLVNRREFEQRLEEVLLIAKTEPQKHSLCYLDLDRFKIVNDTCGHGAGDELLRQVTALLRSQVRATDLLARLGGDEFGLLLYNCSPKQALAIANSLRQSLQEFRFIWDDKTFTIGVSIGLVAIDPDTPNLTNALNAADAACYVAKNTGRNRVHIYQSDDREVARQHSQIHWVAKLTKALEKNRFCLYYQPIISLAPDRSAWEHYEVLLRLHDETGTLVSPMIFIPAAERYHLMQNIDRWVIRTLFASQGEYYRENWNRCQQKGERCMYSINLSGASMVDDQFVDFLHEQFAAYRVPPQVICFEITETVAITNLSRARKLIHEVKNLGSCFALDDFGSGMSSFAYLRNLPVDYLKIDGDFIKDIVEDATDLALTEAINHIGHVMGLQTIAEFVENNTILEKLKVLGVDYAQGYGIAKPRPLCRTQ